MRHRKQRTYWRFTYRYYRHQWWFLTKPRLKRELSDILDTLRTLMK